MILVGGPSGIGKSRLAHELALVSRSNVAQIDDMQGAIETLVPEDRLPEFYNHRNRWRQSQRPEDIAEAIWRISTFFEPAIEWAIENRIESGTSTVFEGDFISPELEARVRRLEVLSIFLVSSEADSRANFLTREGDEQPYRAKISFLHGEKLREACRLHGLACLNATSYGTLLSRVCVHLLIENTARE